ncbi:MAG: hypothetical protein H6Q72_1914 [Firmicutes bacterium]|nr:hypothetical protein [Bacillota bacterium]
MGDSRYTIAVYIADKNTSIIDETGKKGTSRLEHIKAYQKEWGYLE